MRILLAIAFTLALLPTSGAEECVLTTSTTDENQIVVELPRNGIAADYVASDRCQPDCIFSIWPYFENNGVEGLQRWDAVVDDTCGGLYLGDTWYEL